MVQKRIFVFILIIKIKIVERFVSAICSRASNQSAVVENDELDYFSESQ